MEGKTPCRAFGNIVSEINVDSKGGYTIFSIEHEHAARDFITHLTPLCSILSREKFNVDDICVSQFDDVNPSVFCVSKRELEWDMGYSLK